MCGCGEECVDLGCKLVSARAAHEVLRGCRQGRPWPWMAWPDNKLCLLQRQGLACMVLFTSMHRGQALYGWQLKHTVELLSRQWSVLPSFGACACGGYVAGL